MAEETKSDEIGKDQEKKQQDEDKEKMGCWAKGGIVLGVLFFIGYLFSGPDVTVKGDIAEIRIKTSASSSLSLLASDLLEDVYDVATEYPDVSRLEVTFIMSKSGLTDKYGNPTEEDLPMGTMTYDKEELAEIRKYKARNTYVYGGGVLSRRDITKGILKIQLRHTHLLDDD